MSAFYESEQLPTPMWQTHCAIEDLAQIVLDGEAQLALEDAEHTRRTTSRHTELRAMREHLIASIKASGAQAIPHPDLVIELKQATKLEKRISVLRELEAIVPPDELKKGLYLDAPPPEWVANATYLKPLAKRYGGRVADILARGIVTVDVGSPQLVITPRAKDEINVTPATSVVVP